MRWKSVSATSFRKELKTKVLLQFMAERASLVEQVTVYSNFNTAPPGKRTKLTSPNLPFIDKTVCPSESLLLV